MKFTHDVIRFKQKWKENIATSSMEDCPSPQISPTIEDPDVYKDIEKMAKQELRHAGQ